MASISRAAFSVRHLRIHARRSAVGVVANAPATVLNRDIPVLRTRCHACVRVVAVTLGVRLRVRVRVSVRVRVGD